MVDVAARLMTVEEFFDWHPPDDRRYELVEGTPRLMAPVSDRHAILAGNAIAAVADALRDTPCRVRVEGGARLPDREDRYYVPDFTVSCSPAQNERWTPEPRILFEILSPSTEGHDRETKLPDYRSIPSVEAIVLVDSSQRFCEVHRRLDGERWQIDLLQDADDVIVLLGGQVELPLAEIYRDVESAPARRGARGRPSSRASPPPRPQLPLER